MVGKIKQIQRFGGAPIYRVGKRSGPRLAIQGIMLPAAKNSAPPATSAIRHWAQRMAPVVEQVIADHRLERANTIFIPIQGREAWGWPVAQLAQQLGAQLGIDVREDVWLPRPRRARDGEAPQSLAEKEAQMAQSHRFATSLLLDRRRRAAFRTRYDERLRGKTIIFIDDNLTTGTTVRAAMGQARRAGARDVFCVAATKTNRDAD